MPADSTVTIRKLKFEIYILPDNQLSVTSDSSYYGYPNCLGFVHRTTYVIIAMQAILKVGSRL